MKQLDETKRELDFAASGPTVRMMLVGKRSKNTKKKSKKEFPPRKVKNYDNAELMPGLRRVVPEWYDKLTGQVNLRRPTSRDLNRGNLVKRTYCFARGEIELVIATFAMHSDGKLPEDVQVEKAEKWLRVRSKSDERALRALPGKAQGSPD